MARKCKYINHPGLRKGQRWQSWEDALIIAKIPYINSRQDLARWVKFFHNNYILRSEPGIAKRFEKHLGVFWVGPI
jgi:hypothetical protein